MKKILALILALCMVLALCACGQEAAAPAAAPAEEKPAEAAPAEAAAPAEEAAPEKAYYNFYDIVKIDGNYFGNEACGIASKIKELSETYNFDYDFHYIGCDNDPEKTMTSLENAIADKASFIFICVPDQTMSLSVVERCEEAGIPVCAVDDGLIDETGAKIAPWRGIDAYNIGYGAGEWLADYASENNLLDDPSVGLLYMTMETVSSCTPRTQGEKDAWAAKLGDALADRTWEADYESTSELAYNAASAVITGHPEITTWLVNTPSENGVEGAVAVLEELGLSENACVVSVGADLSVDQWADGNWDCVKMSTYFSAIVIGQTAAADAIEYLVNGTELVKEFACPAIPIDASNYTELYIYADQLDYVPFK